MAASVAEVLQRVCSENLRGVKLKKEQEQAVLALLEKKDVFAILLTGFGKSLIYQCYCVAKSAIEGEMPAVIAVISLRSIAADLVKNDVFDLKAAQFSLDQQKLQAVASLLWFLFKQLMRAIKFLSNEAIRRLRVSNFYRTFSAHTGGKRITLLNRKSKFFMDRA